MVENFGSKAVIVAKYYLVGGAVRDSFLGKNSKDKDYAVEAESFEAMRSDITAKGGKIFLEKPEFLTICARFGRDTADYVLCRKDGAYSDGRHPDQVEIGTIRDDLARRDFTMNAIALDEEGKLIDPFGGYADIHMKIIRCVGDVGRLEEDALRMVRAIRFAITLDFEMNEDIRIFVRHNADKLRQISQERVREELTKCFAHDTILTLSMLMQYPGIAGVAFEGKMWLKPTFEER